MCHINKPPGLNGYFLNENFCVGLSVALLSAVTLLCMHLVDDYLLRSGGFFHECRYACPRNERGAERVLIAQNGKNPVEYDLFTDFFGQLLDVKRVALRNAVLLTACFNNGCQYVHLINVETRCQGWKQGFT